MTSPLEPYQKTPAPMAQPLPGWPQTAPLTWPVELGAERPAIVWVPDAYGRMVPMPKHLAPPRAEPTPPRDLAPQPLIDPRAQILAAGGVCAAGVGWGAAQVISALAGATTAIGLLLLALVAAKLTGGGKARGGDTYVTHNHAHWWGKTTTNN